VASAVKASKVIYFTDRAMELQHAVHGKKVPHLRLSSARQLLKYIGITMHRKGYVTLKDDIGAKAASILKRNNGSHSTTEEDRVAAIDMLLKIGWSTLAVKQGVPRAHILSPKHGAVLQELYTRDGSGTLISGDLYEGIRQASVLDVNIIYDLISPLIQAGTLVDRPKSTLEKDIDTFYVYTRDNLVVATGQVKQFEDGFAEIGCLVVNTEYRAGGRGDAMLGYLERLCVVKGCKSIFVLSTQTMEWFVERGFKEVDVTCLPSSRQATYNHERNSKIYMKRIENVRDLDASELRWNR